MMSGDGDALFTMSRLLQLSRLRARAVTYYWRWRVHEWPLVGPITSRLRAQRALEHSLAHFGRPEALERLVEEKPPADERVRLPAFWLAEVFTPSTFGRLDEGIRRLGLGRSPTEDRGEFIRSSRAKPWPGSWSNLSWLASDKNDRMWGHAVHHADLPTSVRFAVPTVLTLTPSLTVLLFQFQLRDDAADTLDRAARADYLPAGRANWDGSTTFWTVDQVRDREVAKIRADLRAEAEAWIGSHFCGAFAELGAALPAAELILVEKEAPYPVGREPRYLHALGLTSPWPPFETEELPGIKLVVRQPFVDEKVLRFASNFAEALSHKALSNYAESSEFSLLQLLED